MTQTTTLAVFAAVTLLVPGAAAALYTAPTFEDEFNRTRLGDAWTFHSGGPRGGSYDLDGDDLLLTAGDDFEHGFATVRYLPPLEEGRVSFTWAPAPGEGEIYVLFRAPYERCDRLLPWWSVNPEYQCADRSHRVILTLAGAYPTVRFDQGLVGATCSCYHGPVPIGGAPLLLDRIPVTVDITHEDGRVEVRVNGEVLGVAAYRPWETATAFELVLAERGGTHAFDSFRYWFA